MALLVLLNNWMHDFSAAGWIFSTFVIMKLIQHYQKDDKLKNAIVPVLKTMKLLMHYSLAGIVIFGIGRALAYKEYEWSEEAGDSQLILLAVKHVVLTAVFIWGVIYYRKALKIIKSS
ncbi:MAG: hypothetical protein OEZ13_06755 [Spirochaetia bacterium]|nr:hypothetical protein [Spirochaetia bacterium]